MSDENTARHAECTVEFDGVDITSSIKPYLLSLTFTDNEEDASDDLQIKLQDREGVWMTDWLQKMLDGDVSAASSDGYKVGDVVQFLGGPHYKASTDKKANGTPKAGPAKITIIKQGALHPYHVIHTDGTSRVYGWVDASEISGKSGGSSSGSPVPDINIEQEERPSFGCAVLSIDVCAVADMLCASCGHEPCGMVCFPAFVRICGSQGLPCKSKIFCIGTQICRIGRAYTRFAVCLRCVFHET